MDPSIATPVTNATVFADPRDTHLPLGGVCETQARAVLASVRTRGDLQLSSARVSVHVSIHLAHSLTLSVYPANSLAVDLSTCLALQARWVRGALVFTLVCTGCLGFVIFATGKAEPLEPLRTYPQSQTQPQLQPQPGKQSLSGLRRVVRGAEPLAVPPVRLDLL